MAAWCVSLWLSSTRTHINQDRMHTAKQDGKGMGQSTFSIILERVVPLIPDISYVNCTLVLSVVLYLPKTQVAE